MRIAIVALGQSGLDYVRLTEGVGGQMHLFDEVWAINGFGSILQCDRVFHMDDVRIQEARAKSGNKKIANMLKWMKKHPGPIYTSRVHPDYPGLVEYPLESILNSPRTTKRAYFDGTVAYAVAMAVHEGVKSISMFGADYVFKNATEKGRACLEYWLGVAEARGIDIKVAKSSSLLDTNTGAMLYGYDTLYVGKQMQEDGSCRVMFAERTPPTAQEIESRYDKVPRKPDNLNGAAGMQA